MTIFSKLRQEMENTYQSKHLALVRLYSHKIVSMQVAVWSMLILGALLGLSSRLVEGFSGVILIVIGFAAWIVAFFYQRELEEVLDRLIRFKENYNL
jgi:uncharacterized membrane protein YesL